MLGFIEDPEVWLPGAFVVGIAYLVASSLVADQESYPWVDLVGLLESFPVASEASEASLASYWPVHLDPNLLEEAYPELDLGQYLHQLL